MIVDVLNSGAGAVAEVKLTLLDMRNNSLISSLISAKSLWKGHILHPFFLILLFGF